MPLTPEIIAAANLTPEQVTAVSDVLNNDIAEVKKTYDGKANTDAEAILDGAAKAVETKTGIAREKGQKVADYITLAAEKHVDGKLASEKAAVQKKQSELDKLIADGATDGALKKKYDELAATVDDLKKKEAEYDRLKDADFENLYNTLKNENSTLKETTAFNSVKPAFPDTVNRYEADAKWNAFVNDVKKSYDIEIVDGIPMGISKENKHKTAKLADLVAKSEEITALTQGRQVKGIGADPKKEVKFKDVPFTVPENATAAERQKAIKDYLVNDLKLAVISAEYSSKYAEYNKKLLEGTPATT